VVTETSGGGTDTVYSLTDYTLGNYVENLNLSPKMAWDFSYGTNTVTAINGTGNALANVITGNYLDNNLKGLAGNDTLSGGAGNDTLTGGAGSDVFLFDTAFSAPNPQGYNYPPLSSGIDTLTDFTSGADKIHLSDNVFTALGSAGALAASEFVANTTGVATTATQRVIYNTASGALFYDADGSGAQHAGIQIALIGAISHPALTGADFLVV
jgi:Ca2+-binding RTX toxin-like protein